MNSLSAIQDEDVQHLRSGFARALETASTLEEASQLFTRRLYDTFPAAAALCRLYGTIPLSALTPGRHAFAQEVALRAGAGRLRDETLVMSLLGTAGELPEWNDTATSRDHLAIPLVSRPFVDSAPMVARMLDELGIELAWGSEGDRASNDAVHVRHVVAGFLGVFHVPEASESKDDAGRFIIPAQDFVRKHGIRTVFGMAGHYAVTGTVAVCIVFCREPVERRKTEQLAAVMSTFKSSTSALVRARRYFR